MAGAPAETEHQNCKEKHPAERVGVLNEIAAMSSPERRRLIPLVNLEPPLLLGRRLQAAAGRRQRLASRLPRLAGRAGTAGGQRGPVAAAHTNSRWVPNNVKITTLPAPVDTCQLCTQPGSACTALRNIRVLLAYLTVREPGPMGDRPAASGLPALPVSIAAGRAVCSATAAAAAAAMEGCCISSPTSADEGERAFTQGIPVVTSKQGETVPRWPNQGATRSSKHEHTAHGWGRASNQSWMGTKQQRSMDVGQACPAALHLRPGCPIT